MSLAFTDQDLEERVERQKAKVEAWIKKRELGEDYVFRSWIEYYDDEPTRDAYAVLLCVDGKLCSVLNGYSGTEDLRDEFAQLFRGTDFSFEFLDHTTLGFWCEAPSLRDAYFRYASWRWVCGLIQPSYADLYEEVCELFLKDPEALHRIGHREFELLLDGIFRNLGFFTELGPGRADGGVDLRLYSTDPISETITLVQARKYSKSRPIRLEAVQALAGVVNADGAHRGLFVTTSRYLPGVKKFAARRDLRITLATSKDVLKWAEQAAGQISLERSRLLSLENVLALVDEAAVRGGEGKIVHASTGYGIVANDFCLIVKESSGAALLMRLPKKMVSHDGYGQRGSEVPDFASVRSYVPGNEDILSVA